MNASRGVRQFRHLSGRSTCCILFPFYAGDATWKRDSSCGQLPTPARTFLFRSGRLRRVAALAPHGTRNREAMPETWDYRAAFRLPR